MKICHMTFEIHDSEQNANSKKVLLVSNANPFSTKYQGKSTDSRLNETNNVHCIVRSKMTYAIIRLQKHVRIEKSREVFMSLLFHLQCL